MIVWGVLWLACLELGWHHDAETVAGACIAIASVITFRVLITSDPYADLARHARISHRAAQRTPWQRLARRVAADCLLAIGVVAVIVGETIPIQSTGCEVIGMSFEGASELSTTCGDMIVDTSWLNPADVRQAFYSGRALDITTRGFIPGFPPQRLIVDLRPD